MVDISKCDQKERDSARKECAILGALKHPNIIEYRESFEDKGQVLACMHAEHRLPPRRSDVRSLSTASPSFSLTPPLCFSDLSLSPPSLFLSAGEEISRALQPRTHLTHSR